MISEETVIHVNKQVESIKPSHPVLEGIARLLPGFSHILGSDCELVLHDFKDVSRSLIAIEGNVTNRSVGSPLTDLILRVICKSNNPPDLLNYLTHSQDGKPLQSSTLFIRDHNGRVIGCLCINRDISYWLMARGLFDEFCDAQPLNIDNIKEGSESFMQDIGDLLEGSINEVLAQERKPINLMDKADKMRVVNALDSRGIFLIRRSVGKVARALNVSRYTIYNYLDELHNRTKQVEGKITIGDNET